MNDDDKQGAAKKLTGDKFNELRFLDARENVAVSESLNMVSLHRKLKSEILVYPLNLYVCPFLCIICFFTTMR